MPKILFSQHILGILDWRKLFRNPASSHFGDYLCVKNQKKLISQSREKLVPDERTDGRTDGRTNGQRLIYRTSKIGPKNRISREFIFAVFTISNFSR